MPYQGGNSAYPVQPLLVCRLAMVLACGGATLILEVDEDVELPDELLELEVEVGLALEPFIGLEGDPPQPTRIASARISK